MFYRRVLSRIQRLKAAPLGSRVTHFQHVPESFLHLQYTPIALKAIHTSVQCKAKLFIDKENQFAHEVLEQSLKPYQIFRLDINEDAKVNGESSSNAAELPIKVLETNELAVLTNIDELYRDFCALVHYCAQNQTLLSEQRFTNFTQLYCKSLERLSDAQLLSSLQQVAHLPTEEMVKAPNYMQLWNALDVECCRRLENWHTDELLLICDVWYTLNLARICEFVELALRKIGRKIIRLRSEQLVQLMFYLNVLRRTPVYEMFDFEARLVRCVDEMTLQELGVMSMGFFKTQTPIRNPALIEQLYRRLIVELDTVEDITLVAILKVLRQSSKMPQLNIMIELLEHLLQHVDRFSLLGCLHVALLGSDLQYCHDGIIERVLQRFSRDIAQTRLKDMERICFVIGVFNFHSASKIETKLYEQILSMLPSKMDEILRHPRSFTACLHFLTLRGFYDVEMLSAALDMPFLRHAFGKNILLGREIFHLDSYVKINLQHASSYTGNQLPDKYRRTMGKQFTHYIPERNPKYKLNTTDRMLLEMKETTDRILRKTAIKHILPQYERADIVICYDNKKREVLPIPAECRADYTGVILTRELLLGDQAKSPDIDTVAIVIAGWNNVVKDRDRFTGLFELKLQQLQLLGHKYIVLYWHKWRELETPADRINFIKRKLATVIKL